MTPSGIDESHIGPSRVEFLYKIHSIFLWQQRRKLQKRLQRRQLKKQLKRQQKRRQRKDNFSKKERII